MAFTCRKKNSAYDQGKMRIGFLVVLEEQNGLSNNVQKGLGCCPYIPLTVTKYQTPLTTLWLTPSLLTSLERRDYWQTGIQKWHLLKIKRLSQAANLMRVEEGGGNEPVPFQFADMKGKERIFMFTANIALKTKKKLKAQKENKAF